MKQIGRGLEDRRIEIFKDSKWYQFYKEHKMQDELFLGIRNNYINIYYKGMNMAKSQGSFQKAYIANKYLGNNENSKDASISFEEFEEKYVDIKKYIDEHCDNQNKKEKKVQQKLIFNNNSNHNSNWVCIDMEYEKQRKSRNDGSKSGRCDIIAVSKEKPYKVAFIELKVGNSAFGEPSGLRKHAKDWEDNFIKNDMFKRAFNKDREDYVLKEIVDIINNKHFLNDNFPIKRCEENDFESIPEFYFLICSGDKDIENIKNSVGQYLWEKETARKNGIKGNISTKNIEKELGYDISKKNNGKLYCNFLFVEGQGEQIKDIINDKKCDRNITK